MSDPQIVWQGERAVVVDKPAGWLCVPSVMGRADERPVLGIWLQEKLGARLWPVHRLDEPVSGLVIFALDAEAHKALGAWFEQRLVKKEYAAWTEATVPPPAGRVTWTSRLLKGKKRAYPHARGKDCETEAEAIGREADGLRWRLWPHTGRPHQLRVELSRRGFPIRGDTLYGAQPWKRDGIALRAVKLELPEGADALGIPRVWDLSG